jgi:hypothetical protein
MREVEFKDFDFGSEWMRTCITYTRDLTFGHYAVGNGFATVAGVLIGNNVYYGISFCSPEDNFSKRTGREYAKKHFRENKYSHMRGVSPLKNGLANHPPVVVFRSVVLNHLAKMDPSHRPQWAKDAPIDFRGKAKRVDIEEKIKMMERMGIISATA